MSSLEEERLIQMVHDFIESETPAIPASTPLCQDYTCLTLEEILGNSTDTEKEILDKAMKYVREIGSEKSRGSVKKRLMMRLRMDGCDAFLCRSSWIATLDCPGGDYEYIVIMKEGDENGGASSSKLIVDVDFKAQFELARPTSAYKK
ncbi:uncharacterized protein A4U43_C07F29360 [Asparagus officinalis]|uniref:Uncharacterized protein n=1 Tax=Asparagus officinalis TaxID=4686 RepID=A0A5P1EFR4_ASPOF|nr:uncharacterized protein LOC109847702 [Asparagus officinalis]ONK64738.1 uncharacterized protein A4U43_C07F29360 [Asparagus officinalis]